MSSSLYAVLGELRQNRRVNHKSVHNLTVVRDFDEVLMRRTRFLFRKLIVYMYVALSNKEGLIQVFLLGTANISSQERLHEA